MQRCYLFLGIMLIYVCMSLSYAAQVIDLSHRPVSILKPLWSHLKLLRKTIDFNQTTHTRYKQMYQGYPVWGGDIIVHAPKGSTGLVNDAKIFMSGTMYQNLEQDLARPPTVNADEMINYVVNMNGFKSKIEEPKAELIVYIDDQHKAHWAFLISYIFQPAQGRMEKPTVIIDAISLKIYQQWDDIQTLEHVSGGGFGGNPTMGKLIYDGLNGDLPKLSMFRNQDTQMCYLQNEEVIVKDIRLKDAVSQFSCGSLDQQHNNIYWDENLGSINGAYSPDNDAFYIGEVVQGMYQHWYGIPVLVKNGQPMMLVMRVHANIENANWDGKQMTFGDGGPKFYPFVSLGIGAHEVSHGFTQQHSSLVYDGQSGGLNESFSDMAAQAAEYYSLGRSSWRIGADIFKNGNNALRYMDEPTKDCKKRKPGCLCSISHTKDYYERIDEHYSSGVFNKAFYLLATTAGWDTKKAFDIMVHANQNYWTPLSTFEEAACGVMKATEDHHYLLEDVKQAFQQVGINTANC